MNKTKVDSFLSKLTVLCQSYGVLLELEQEADNAFLVIREMPANQRDFRHSYCQVDNSIADNIEVEYGFMIPELKGE